MPDVRPRVSPSPKIWRSLGTQYADHSVLETVKQTASDPSQTLAFNYASEALNNSFFLSTLVSSSARAATFGAATGAGSAWNYS